MILLGDDNQDGHLPHNKFSGAQIVTLHYKHEVNSWEVLIDSYNYLQNNTNCKHKVNSWKVLIDSYDYLQNNTNCKHKVNPWKVQQ